MKQLSLIVLLLSVSTFSQTPGGGLTDIDGNNYNSVIIGTQEWQKQNLNVSKYTDGTLIPQVTDPTAWANLTTGAWCYSNNDPANGAIYGKLYNWYAVAGLHDNDPNTPNKVIAPLGWHVPTDVEWNTLTTFLGGETVAGSKIKETGNTHWINQNTDASNISNFTALPGGYRNYNGEFYPIGANCSIWSSSEYDNSSAWHRYLYYNNGFIYRDLSPKMVGVSIRLLNNTLLNNQSYNLNSFNIYPNPAKDQITVDLVTNSNIVSGIYKIINAIGQEVQNGVLSSQQNIINLNNIKEQGVYFVKIYDNSNTLMETKKIIIQK
jgi:uncharacterized protein (TIGR02145 family)